MEGGESKIGAILTNVALLAAYLTLNSTLNLLNKWSLGIYGNHSILQCISEFDIFAIVTLHRPRLSVVCTTLPCQCFVASLNVARCQIPVVVRKRIVRLPRTDVGPCFIARRFCFPSLHDGVSHGLQFHHPRSHHDVRAIQEAARGHDTEAVEGNDLHRSIYGHQHSP